MVLYSTRSWWPGACRLSAAVWPVPVGGSSGRCARLSRCTALRRSFLDWTPPARCVWCRPAWWRPDLAAQGVSDGGAGGRGTRFSRCTALRRSFLRWTPSARCCWCRPGWWRPEIAAQGVSAVVPEARARGSHVVWHCIGASCVGRGQPGGSGAGQVGVGQVGAGQVGAGQVGAGQVGAGQVGAGQVGAGSTSRHGAYLPAVPASGACSSHVAWHCVRASRAERGRPGGAGAAPVGDGHRGTGRVCRWCRRPVRAVLTLHGIVAAGPRTATLSHRGRGGSEVTLYGIAFELLASNAVGRVELVPPRLVPAVAAQGVSAGGAGVRCGRFPRCMALRRRDP